MKPKSTKRTPAAATDALNLIDDVASLQEKRAAIRARVAFEVREIDLQISRKTQALDYEVRNSRMRPYDIAATVQDALALKRVNTGELSTGFIDTMAIRGASVYPTKYQPITSQWDVIESRPWR